MTYAAQVISKWSEDMNKCKSCKEGYGARDATHYGFPLMSDGTNDSDPWPLCEIHAYPYAAVSGWRPIEITEAIKCKKLKYRVKAGTERIA